MYFIAVFCAIFCLAHGQHTELLSTSVDSTDQKLLGWPYSNSTLKPMRTDQKLLEGHGVVEDWPRERQGVAQRDWQKNVIDRKLWRKMRKFITKFPSTTTTTVAPPQQEQHHDIILIATLLVAALFMIILVLMMILIVHFYCRSNTGGKLLVHTIA